MICRHFQLQSGQLQAECYVETNTTLRAPLVLALPCMHAAAKLCCVYRLRSRMVTVLAWTAEGPGFES